jgi:hypothetical protein
MYGRGDLYGNIGELFHSRTCQVKEQNKIVYRFGSGFVILCGRDTIEVMTAYIDNWGSTRSPFQE